MEKNKKVGDTVRLYDYCPGKEVEGTIIDMVGGYYKVHYGEQCVWMDGDAIKHIEEVVLPSKEYNEDY